MIAEGYRVVGFDNERHVYGAERYPGQLVIQDVLTIHGRQFKDVALIVASPPCQEYSYRAMPWKRAKALPPPSNALFEACFRIQAEAIEAAGHFIPLVVENVRGAQKYVGRARYHFGSFYLWGDVPALMPIAKAKAKVGGITFSGYGTPGYKAIAFNSTADQRLRAEETKNDGGSWFAVAHNKGPRHNPVNDHRKISPARRAKQYDQTEKMRIAGDGVKFSQSGDAWFNGKPRDKMLGALGPAAFGSRSRSRKRASAMIAKIPLVLSRHIAASWYPQL